MQQDIAFGHRLTPPGQSAAQPQWQQPTGDGPAGLPISISKQLGPPAWSFLAGGALVLLQIGAPALLSGAPLDRVLFHSLSGFFLLAVPIVVPALFFLSRNGNVTLPIPGSIRGMKAASSEAADPF